MNERLMRMDRIRALDPLFIRDSLTPSQLGYFRQERISGNMVLATDGISID